jgi:hypothetical protein
MCPVKGKVEEMEVEEVQSPDPALPAACLSWVGG